MDIRMPVMDGLEATAELLARRGAAPRVVMLTTFDLDEARRGRSAQGASGFLLKDADPEFLLAAIRTVHAGLGRDRGIRHSRAVRALRGCRAPRRSRGVRAT